MRSDALKELWREGGTALGAWLSLREPVAVEAIANHGFDYICVDMQHGLAELRDAVAMLQAISRAPSTPIVRVPWNEPGIIGRVLDAGAMGVIVPMVNSVEEAQRAVAACRYAPAGARSFGPLRAGFTWGSSYYATANDHVACIPMIETKEAVSRIDDILAVPGIDAVYVGPADLSITYGLPPGVDNPGDPFDTAIKTIVDACAARGIIAGIHSVAQLAAKRKGQGFRMITIASDMGALTAGMARDLKLAQGDTPPAPTEADTAKRSPYS